MKVVNKIFAVLLWLGIGSAVLFSDEGKSYAAYIDENWKEGLEMQKGKARLSTNIRPIFYDISIQPWIHLKHSNEFHFNGSVSILFRCDSYQQTLAIHVAPNIVLDDEHVAVFDGKMRPVKIAFAAYLPKRNLKMIIFHRKLKPLKTYRVLFSKYSSKMLGDGKGFYFQEYKEGNDKRFVASAMLSPLYARNVFPCFDDPQFESQFALKIIRQRQWKSQSIMPIKKTTSLENDWETDEYEKTPMMQIYQFTFAVNEFLFIEGLTKSGKTVRLWAPERDLHLCQFSLGEIIDGLNFNEVYFDSPYPLPKLDVVTAMSMSDEETGSSTYGLLLLKRDIVVMERIKDVGTKKRNNHIIQHEISHIWIGNNLKINWFDSLWFLEGFCSFMEGKSAENRAELSDVELDKGHSQTIAGLYVDGSESYSSLSAYPVSAKDVEKYFNDQIFLKGYAVVRMVEKIVGSANLQMAMQTIMKDKEKQPMSSRDVWRYVDKVLKVTNLEEIMSPWESQVGYPILKVHRNGRNKFEISQQGNRLSNRRDLWPIPITYIARNGMKISNFKDILWIQQRRKEIVSSRWLDKDDWIIFNHERTGYFRVNYDMENVKNVIHQLRTNHKVIPALARMHFIDDFYYFFSHQQLAKPDLLFEMLSYMTEEEEYPIWMLLRDMLDALHPVFGSSVHVEKMNKFVRSLISKRFDEINWSRNSSKSNEELRLLDVTVLDIACRYGHEKCISWSKMYFREWLTTKRYKTHPFFYETILCIGVQTFGPAAWLHVLTETTKQQYNDFQRNMMIKSLSCTNNERLLQRLWNSFKSFSTKYSKKIQKLSVDYVKKFYSHIAAKPAFKTIICSLSIDMANDFEYAAALNTLQYSMLPSDCELNKQIEDFRKRKFIRPFYEAILALEIKEQREFVKERHLDRIRRWLDSNF